MKSKIKLKHVLLVEDNLLNQKFALAVLKMNGYTADVAENGKIGLEKYKNNEYDLILMDIQMPIMDGIECTKEIRKIESENNWERIQIIAVTAFAMPGDEQKFLEAGLDNYLAKPYKGPDLISIIQDVNH
ncbi:MAG: histidine kinase [Marinilabiliales bacterium]|nr:MAG: histidine kinase [Marinilabiliales bacterium]